MAWIRSRRVNLKPEHVPLRSAVRLSWWASDARRKHLVGRFVAINARPYWKASKGYRLSPVDVVLRKGRFHVEIVSQWHPVHGWLNIRHASLAVRDGLAGRLAAHCKSLWAEEAAELAKFNACEEAA